VSEDFWQTISDFVAAEMRGAEQERERIIKLLESFDPRTAIGDLLPLLIKGEQK